MAKPQSAVVGLNLVEMSICRFEKHLAATIEFVWHVLRTKQMLYATPIHSHRIDRNNFLPASQAILWQFYAPQPTTLARTATCLHYFHCLQAQAERSASGHLATI